MAKQVDLQGNDRQASTKPGEIDNQVVSPCQQERSDQHGRGPGNPDQPAEPAVFHKKKRNQQPEAYQAYDKHRHSCQGKGSAGIGLPVLGVGVHQFTPIVVLPAETNRKPIGIRASWIKHSCCDVQQDEKQYSCCRQQNPFFINWHRQFLFPDKIRTSIKRVC